MLRNLPRFISWMILLSGVVATHPLSAQAIQASPGRVLLLWNTDASQMDSLDQRALETTLSSAGYSPERIAHFDPLSEDTLVSSLLVIPHSAATLLSGSQAASICQAVLRGLTLITDGPSSLMNSLGLKLGSPMRVSEIIDNFRPDIHPFWSDTPTVPWFSGLPDTDVIIAYSDKASHRALAVVLTLGKGRCLCLAPLFDPRTGRGYSRFTTLPGLMIKHLGRPPAFIRRSADVYFDAGYRLGISPDSLARMWRTWGIRAVHAAAWYSYDSIPYDYHALIDALHRNGILAYAWLEWPYIGKGFWDDHPQWRQKTALLQDAHLDFLYLMDLENPECMKAALDDLKRLLGLDWDGIDVAEFTLTGAGKEALEGPARADYFTGFTNVGRSEFKKRAGFDPLELFNRSSKHYWKTDTLGLKSFYRYRTNANKETQDHLFSALTRMNRVGKRSWELILTIVDNALHPEFDNLLGFSMGSTLNLINTHQVTLHVEDPYPEWLKPPERYRSMGAYYKNILGGRPFMIDINVVPMMPDRFDSFSTPQPAGTEFLQLWKFAAERTDRICFYCEATIPPADWELLPYAMAGGTSAMKSTGGMTILAPRTVVLRTKTAESDVRMDGRRWPALSDSEVIIPPGKHTLRILPHLKLPQVNGIGIVAVNGELLDARWSGNKLDLEYDSPSRCAITLSTFPNRMYVDGKREVMDVTKNGTSCVLLAPPGKHRLVLQ